MMYYNYYAAEIRKCILRRIAGSISAPIARRRRNPDRDKTENQSTHTQQNTKKLAEFACTCVALFRSANKSPKVPKEA